MRRTSFAGAILVVAIASCIAAGVGMGGVGQSRDSGAAVIPSVLWAAVVQHGG